MRRLLFSVVVAAAVLVSPAAAPSAAGERVRVLVSFASAPTAADVARLERAGATVEHRYRIVPAVAAAVPRAAIAGLGASPRVTAVEPDGAMTALDYRSTHDWGIAHVRADEVHANGQTGTSGAGTRIRVAVTDTGTSCQHVELDANCVLGPTYVDGTSSSDDDNGHGTHVGGTVAAERNVGVSTGVVGVAPTATVISYKVLDSGGSGSWSDLIAAIDHIWNGGAPRAEVVNMSLGGSSAPGALEEAMNRAYASGVVLVAAAGNGGNCGGSSDSVSYPARYASVVAVAAVNSDNQRPCWSSTGSDVELAAPGVSVFSTWPEDLSTSAHNPQPVCEGGSCHYKYGSGTSMASPHVAGAAALLLATGIADVNGANGAADEVRQRLAETAVDLGSTGRDSHYGYGLIDAAAATAAIDPVPSVSLTSPADGAVVSGTVVLAAEASDDVTQVEFLLDGVAIATDMNGDDGWSVSWDTTTATEGLHALAARATDTAGQAATHELAVTVDNLEDPPSMHVGDLDGGSANGGSTWQATVTIRIDAADHTPVEGALVAFAWSGGYTGTGSCTTGTDGLCAATSGWTRKKFATVTLTVTSASQSSLVYDSSENHDPDGSSDGTAITVSKP